MEHRLCSMTPQPGVVPGDCLSVCVYTVHFLCVYVCVRFEGQSKGNIKAQ